MNARILAFAGITRFHIVLIAGLGTFTFAWLLTGHESAGLALVSGFDWFLVNLLNRVVDAPEDRANRVVGAESAARRARVIVPTGLALLAASFPAVEWALPGLLVPRAAYHALGLAYNWRLLPAPGGRRVRLKQLYAAKNAASACGFLLTLFAYPLAAWPGAGDRALAPAGITVLAVFFFLFEVSYEVIYDLRDAPGDRAAGIRTFPAVHGERRAGRLVYVLLGLSAAVLLGGFLAGAVRWRAAILAAAPALQGVLFRAWTRRRRITGADCVLLTLLGAALLLVYNVWRWAGLPLDLF
ncbi:MAG: UbiA family prenyltransferase [Planctomycetes bacterium]|nr:UbiA family prenyltransferase [Planctomycetota bacterium]